MNKIVAADELIRLSVMFGSLTEVAEMLRNVGSLEQAAAEAKAAREAETLELEKVKASVKRAKDDLAKQEIALQDQEQSFAQSQALALAAWEEQRKAHADSMKAHEDAALTRLAQIEARIVQAAADEKAVIQLQVDEVRGELEQAGAQLADKRKELTDLETKLDKAKKALTKLGMKFDSDTDA